MPEDHLCRIELSVSETSPCVCTWPVRVSGNGPESATANDRGCVETRSVADFQACSQISTFQIALERAIVRLPRGEALP